jgi:hypothetical protein
MDLWQVTCEVRVVGGNESGRPVAMADTWVIICRYEDDLVAVGPYGSRPVAERKSDELACAGIEPVKVTRVQGAGALIKEHRQRWKAPLRYGPNSAYARRTAAE